MELKDFVKDAIRQIADAVTELNGENGKGRLLINPAVLNGNDGATLRGTYNEQVGQIVNVEFDLSVTVNDTSASGGQIKLLSAIVGGGVKSESSKESKEVSRLRFQLPVIFPHS